MAGGFVRFRMRSDYPVRVRAAFVAVLGLGAALSALSTGWLLDGLAERDLPTLARWFAGPQAAAPISRAGALQVAFFSWAPLAVATYAVLAAADLSTDAAPSSRTLLARVPGFVGGMLALAAAASTGLVITRLLGGEDGLSTIGLAAAPFALVPLGLACGGLGMMVGVVARSRRLTTVLVGAETMVVFGLLVAADEVATLDALRYLSPFHYSDARHVLTRGVEIWHAAVLLTAFVLQATAASALTSSEPRPAMRWLRRGLAVAGRKHGSGVEPGRGGSWDV